MARTFRFVIVPKVEHIWFDEVHKGAQTQSEILSREFGINMVVDYMPPSICNIIEQNAILEKVSANSPDGIAVDPVDAVNNMTAIKKIRDQNIAVVLFDSPAPDASFTSIGNNYAQQGVIAAERLVKILDYAGKVAVMQGYPTAPNHKQRYQAQIDVLEKYPNINIVDGGIDNDDIETAQEQASAVLESHPDLKGYLCCNASGPIGIARAIKKAGKIGIVKVVGMDGIRPILEAIKEGIIDSSSSTIPKMQGALSVLMLWQAALGAPMPQAIDTGIDLITRENVDLFLADKV